MQTRDSSESGYYVHQEGAISGPFDLGLIQAMVLSGVYPSDVRIQKEGDSRVFPLSELVARPSPRPQPGTVHGAASPVASPSPAPVRPQKQRGDNTLAWVLGFAAILFTGWLVWMSNSKQTPAPSSGASLSSTTRNSREETPRVSTPTLYSPPAVIYKAPAVSPSPAVYRQETPSTLYRDALGNTYRVSMSDYYRLQLQKTAIESDKVMLDSLESELDRLSSQLDRDRIYLNRTSQYQVDSYNEKVHRLNRLNEDAQAKFRSYNSKVDEFNRELERVGTRVR